MLEKFKEDIRYDIPRFNKLSPLQTSHIADMAAMPGFGLATSTAPEGEWTLAKSLRSATAVISGLVQRALAEMAQNSCHRTRRGSGHPRQALL
jgi:hypothetical protein